MKVNVKCEIRIHGNRATLAGEYPLELVRRFTSFYVPNAHFSKKFRRKVNGKWQGWWDGRVHLFDKRTRIMPIGLVEHVVEKLQEYCPSGSINVTDTRKTPLVGAHGFELEGIEFGQGIYDYQLEAAQKLVEATRGILKIATNGGKTEIAIAVTKHLRIPTLFVVRGLDLIRQTRKRFAKRLGIPLESIGVIAEGEYQLGDWITVASLDSLHPRLNSLEFLKEAQRWQLLWADECHEVGSDTFYNVMKAIPAHYRYGLSATPLMRTDAADLRLIAQTGDVVYSVNNKLLVERGISAQPYVEMIRIKEPVIPEGVAWTRVHREAIVENKQLNQHVIEKIHHAQDNGLQIVVMVDQIKHGKTLLKAFKKNPTVRFLTGKEDGEAREEAYEAFTKRELQCLIVTAIMDKGVDVPNIDVLVFAAGGKAKIRTLQRAGRGLRNGEGKDRLFIVDFANFCHRYTTEHSLERLELYKQEGCFMISAA